MAILAWRNDADGFAFQNNWTFDATERAALTGLAQFARTGGPRRDRARLPHPGPDSLDFDQVAAHAAASYPAVGPLPAYGLCGGMAYTALDHWKHRVPIARGRMRAISPLARRVAPSAIRNSIWQRLLDSLGPGGFSTDGRVVAPLEPGSKGVQRRSRGSQEPDVGEWDSYEAASTPGRRGQSVWCVEHGTSGINTRSWSTAMRSRPRSGDAFRLRQQQPVPVWSESDHEARSHSTFGGRHCPHPISARHSPASSAATISRPHRSECRRAYGEFLSWTAIHGAWMVTDGARMPIAGPAELSALGGSAARSARPELVRPPLPSGPATAPSFVTQLDSGCSSMREGRRSPIPDTTWLDRFGGAGRVRGVPDNTIARSSAFPTRGHCFANGRTPRSGE